MTTTIKSTGPSLLGQAVSSKEAAPQGNKTEKVALENFNKERGAGPQRRMPTKKVRDLTGFDKKAVVETSKQVAEETPKFAGRDDPAFRAALTGLVGHGKPMPKNAAAKSEGRSSPPPETKDSPSVPADADSLRDPIGSPFPAKKVDTKPAATAATAKKAQTTVNNKGLFGILGALWKLISADACTVFMLLSRCSITKKANTQKIA